MSDVEMLDFEAFKERYEKVPVEEYPNNVREAVPDPVVSVHLLTYNHADYIREAIESVLMQEVGFPMEIVLGDDDSSDGTREICIEYAEEYPDLIRLQLHHRENNIHLRGQPTHVFQYWYNTLSARGDYIAILSGDDYWTDTRKLQKQVSFLRENPTYSLTYHNMSCTIQENNQGKSRQDQCRKDLSKTDLMVGPLIPPTTVVYCNHFSEICPDFMSTMCEDRIVASVSGKYGKAHYENYVGPTKYRSLKSSMHNSTESYNKVEDFLMYTNILIDFHSNEPKGIKKLKNKRLNILKSMFYVCVNKNKHEEAILNLKRIMQGYWKKQRYIDLVWSFLSAVKFTLEDKLNKHL